MDDQTQHSPHSSRSTSETLAGSPQRPKDGHEHEDSPMRKKPRLGSAAASPMAADADKPADGASLARSRSSSRHPSDKSSVDMPTDTSPSKVTLNLRRLNSHPTRNGDAEQQTKESSQLAATSSSRADSSPSAASDEGVTVLDASRCSPPAPRSPPVVDISLDDATSEEEDIPDRRANEATELRRLIYCFPGNANVSLEDAVDNYINVLEDNRLTTSNVKELAEWLSAWSHFTIDKPHQWSNFYEKYKEFWSLLGQLVHKMLLKKYTIYNLSGSRASLREAVFTLLDSYVTICSQLAAADIKSLTERSADPFYFFHWSKNRHLKALSVIFTRLETSTIWRFGTDPRADDVALALCRFAETFLLRHKNAAGTPFALASTFAEALESKNGNQETLLQIIIVGNNALSALFRHSVDTDITKEHLSECQTSGISFVEGMLRELFKVIEKQTPTMSAELAQHFIDSLANTWRFLMYINPMSLTQALQPWGRLAFTASNAIFAETQRLAMLLTAYRRLVAKGRLELRVLGAHKMGQALLDLYNNSKDPGSSTDEEIRQLTADWIIDERVLEKIVSIDSHPGVVNQSSNIMGFLTSTRTWTPSMTDAIFDTICASQDPRLTSAILDTFGGTLMYASTDIIEDVGLHVCRLPIEIVSTAILNFLSNLTNLLLDKDGSLELLSQTFELLVRLLQHAVHIAKVENGDSGSLSDKAQALLTQLSALHTAESVKRRVCEGCVEDIRTVSSTATGSTRAIEAIVRGDTDQRLIDYIIWHLEAPMALSECLVAQVIDASISSLDQANVTYSFKVLLTLLVDLMVHRPNLSLSPETEAKLWQHLVGMSSVNEQYRNEAWHLLSRLCKEATSTHAFVERCIQEYLPEMKPDSFTLGLIDFIHAAIQYRIRIQFHDKIPSDAVLQVPLADYLWNIISKCQSDVVATCAIRSLCDFHISSDLLRNAPLPAAVECHEAFVDFAITKLETSARLIKNSPPSSDTNDVHDGALSFKRTIDCLQRFLEAVSQDRRFLVERSGSIRISPELAHDLDEENLVTLKFQPFPPGQNIEELTISSLVSLNELYEALQQRTRFPDFRTICGGRNIDLKGEVNQNVKSIAEKGLFLVQNLSADRLPSSTSPTPRSISTAGKAVFSRFNRVFDLLSLPDDQSCLVFELMKDFEPYSYTQDMLQSSEVSGPTLFDPIRRYKTLYVLHCLLKLVPGLSKDKAEDSRYLKEVSQKVFTAIETPSVAALRLGERAHEAVTEAYIQCLLQCLKFCVRAGICTLPHSQGTVIVSRVCEVLDSARILNQHHHSTLILVACDSIKQICVLSRDSLDPLVNHNRTKPLHEWLLVQQQDPFIRHNAQHCIHAVVDSVIEVERNADSSAWPGYWELLLSLVPTCSKYPVHSQHLLQLLTNLIQSHTPTDNTLLSIQILNAWLEMLLQREETPQRSCEDPETFICGLTRLISMSLISSQSLLHTVNAEYWIGAIFKSLLFPEIVMSSDTTTQKSAAMASVLNSEARKSLYELLVILSFDKAGMSRITDHLKPLTYERLGDDILSWEQDRSLLLRASCGYAGLRNLTNTCYMNSLLSQLFMNPRFSTFIMDASIIDGNSSQKLLSATQNLFKAMLQSQRKYADTEDFAYSVKPYDAPVIDVTIQMDVDEFYNLLFEQWEDQIMDKDAKHQFRSIYGGRSVTQIKSLDCDHVSERMEEYLTVSCEVKGKRSLDESLQAFVSGDSMEGDNKYKCESCGDRYVNAVKRSCLKDVPDHLAFHLKRFDFDLLTLQRCKIHDHFTFPEEIDMAPYTYSAMLGNGEGMAPDVFDLVGVLIHSGSAEAGHYYSYIRERRASRSQRPTWLEFNDTDVTEFDPSKIPESCYGGSFESEQFRWPKPFCAYMLFYERRHAASSGDSSTAQSVQQPQYYLTSPTAQDLAIAKENDLLIRWYCLMDPQHATFLRALMTRAEELNKSASTEGHGNHTLSMELINIAVDHLHKAVSRSRNAPEFESTAFGVETLVMECPHCCSALIEQLTKGNPSPMTDMLIRCPVQKVRMQMADLVHGLLRAVRDHDDYRTTLYGMFRPSSTSRQVEFKTDACFFQIIHDLSSQMEVIGSFSRLWDEYFQLFERIADLGLDELTSVLLTSVLELSMVLIFTSDPPQQQNHPFFEISTRAIGRNRKFTSYIPILSLVSRLLSQVDTEDAFHGEHVERIDFADPESGLLPVNQAEYSLIHSWEAKTYSFLVKCLEATNENEHALSHTADIAACLLKGNPSVAHLQKMVITVSRSVEEYYHNFQHLPLTLALPVCAHTPHRDSIRPIFHALRKKAMDFERGAESCFNITRRQSDFGPQNGEAILVFLEQVADMKEPRCAKEHGEYPLRVLVFSVLPTCGARLLLFDDAKVRERTLRLIRNLLLKDVAIGDNNEMGEGAHDDYSRVKAVLELLHQCASVYAVGHKLGAEPSTCKQLIKACESAMSFLSSIEKRQAKSDTLKTIYLSIEDEYIAVMEQFESIRGNNDKNSREVHQIDDEGGKF